MNIKTIRIRACYLALLIPILTFINYAGGEKPRQRAEFGPSKFGRTQVKHGSAEPSAIASALPPGTLDPSFNMDGKVTTDFSSDEVGNAVAIQSDGKIVVAGSGNTSDGYDFAVFRYHANGVADTSFGINGVVTTAMGELGDYAYTIAIQSDGKIVVAGTSDIAGYDYSFALARYNADGSLDSSFGAGGKVITQLPHSGISEIAIQPDGKIVAAGSTWDYSRSELLDFAVARYLPNGSLDTTFGVNGIVETDFAFSYERASSVAIQSDGKIVAGGDICYDDCCFLPSFALVRYNPNGSLDTSFGVGGKVRTSFSEVGSAYANSIVIQPDGRIIAVGSETNYDYGNADLALARYNSDGSLDNSFDSDGLVTTDLGRSESANSIALQGDGRIVLAGETRSYVVGDQSDFVVARYNANGSIDGSFGTNGSVTTSFLNADVASAVAIQADGKIVAAGHGYTEYYVNSDLALARYTANGILDPAFDGDGKSNTSIDTAASNARAVALRQDGYLILAGTTAGGSSTDFAVAIYYNGYLQRKTITKFGTDSANVATSVAVQADGGFVAAGYTDYGSTRDFALVRYTADGSVDSLFGSGGRVETVLPYWSEIHATVIQPDGKIVVAGYVDIGDDFSLPMALARYDSHGSLDATFGDHGIVIVAAASAANAIALQDDGKIVVVGYVPGFNFPNFYSDFAITRLTANGSLDTSFDGDGIATTHFADFAVATAVAVMPDQRIVASGRTQLANASTMEFALAQYNPNGSLDVSFGDSGKVRTPIDESLGATGIGIQRNGKIVVAGYTTGHSGPDFTVLRYRPNGTLDKSFDLDGLVTTDFSGETDLANAIAIQRDGMIVAAGTARTGGRHDFAAARYFGDPVRSRFDYDGDGRSDVSVFRSTSGGSWFVSFSGDGRSEQLTPHFPAETIVPADYDGDGRTDIAQFNSTTGTWYVINSGNGRLKTFRFGAPGDVPTPSDYDGDSKADFAVYRPSTGTWWILRSSDGAFHIERFGLPDDKPVAADYDGDGLTDIAVYRPSDGTWYILRSTKGFSAIHFGLAEDKPIVGDFDGDGSSDLAVFRPSTNVWYILRSATGFTSVQFGAAGDIPASADFDGDGKQDVATFRPSSGIWYILQSSDSSVSYRHFGTVNDLPTQAAFIQ